MSEDPRRTRVVFECRSGHRHDLCMTVSRGVPPELRCQPDQGPGYGPGGGAGCVVPKDLQERVERELRDSMQESRRQGFVLVTQ